MGWTRWGFELAFFFLALEGVPDEKLFDHSQRETLRMGGDSDTNCAIVGGLIGAAVGLLNIDPAKVKKVLTCDTAKGRHKRPDFLNPGKGDVRAMIEQLLEFAPEKLEVLNEPK